MSSKLVIAAAAVAAVAATQTEASRPMRSLQKDHRFRPQILPMPVDEEQLIYMPNVNIDHKSPVIYMPNVNLFDEEAKANWNFNAGIQGGAGGKPQWNAQIGATWEEEAEQKLRLNKVVKGIKKVNNVVNKAEQLGLLEEESEQVYWPCTADPRRCDELRALRLKKITQGIKKVNDVVTKAQQVGLLDEEQKSEWGFNAGIQGGAGGKPQWQVGINGKWDEEEQIIGRGGFPGSTGPYNPTPPFSPWEEEQDQEQKLRLKKIVKGIKKVNNVVNKAQEVGLLEEESEQVYWPCTADPRRCDELRAFRLKKTLLDEEQADWNFNAGIQGGAGGKPQWNAQIGATWEEEEEQKKLIGKLNNALDIVDRAVSTTNNIKSLFEEEQEVEKAAEAVKKIKKACKHAAHKNLLDKATQERLRAKFDKVSAKVEKAKLGLRRRF